jgi:hypothetical protein
MPRTFRPVLIAAAGLLLIPSPGAAPFPSDPRVTLLDTVASEESGEGPGGRLVAERFADFARFGEFDAVLRMREAAPLARTAREHAPLTAYVPEPRSLILLGSGIVVLSLLRRARALRT